MKTTTSALFVFAAVALGNVTLLSPVGHADCGSIPFATPLTMRDLIASTAAQPGKNIEFNPLEVVVYEPGQRGIILWNGREQILLHTTDIRTSVSTPLLEVMPFPSEPTVTLGEVETFLKMQQLLIDKSMWRVASGGGVPGVQAPAAEVTFYEQMGVHEIAVVKVNEPAYFTQWVTQFLQAQQAVNPVIDPRFIEIIDNYLERGIHWFVFDTIHPGDELHSKQPLQFRFTTDAVWYPLEISSLETGKTMVDLLLVTQGPITSYDDLSFAVKRDNGVQLMSNELRGVSEDWATFMGQPKLTMQRVYIRGKLSKMKTDFKVR